MVHRTKALRRKIEAARTRWRILSIVLCLAAIPASPQVMSESEIKAGFLFNFTRFVDWPDSAFRTPNAPFAVCVLGDSTIATLLAGAASGKAINGRAIAVRAFRLNDDPHACQILFVDSTEQRHAQHLLEFLRASPVLTVGESPGFLAAGGILNFAIQDNKVKLELNLAASSSANLKVSAKLIAVSRLTPSSSTGRS